MHRRPLVFALALALLPASAFAEDLLQTYELARTGDPTFAAAESQRLATREGAVQARAALLPQISGGATLQRTYPSNEGDDVWVDNDNDGIVDPGETVSIEGTTTRTYGINADQMLFDYSRISSLRSQREISRATDFQLESAGDDLVTRTSAAYFNVLVAMETLAAAEAQEAALKKQFDFADKRLEVGLAPITDVHEARAQYDAARASTIVTRNALEDAYQALTEITGQPITNLKALPQDFQPQLPETGGVDEWIARAIENNPDLKAQEYLLRSAEADIQTARAGHLPTLYLSADYSDSKTISGGNGLDSGFGSDDGNRGGTLGVTLSVPIFSGGATQSQVRQAVAQRDVSQDQLEQIRRALVRNTRNAYQTLVAGISEVEARRSAVTSARAAYEASQVGLEVGTRTVLDVLQNQQTLFNAEREYALARYNFLQSRLLLEQAAGALDAEDVQDVNRLLTADASTREVGGAAAQ
jgi:outer membrane protein